MKFLVIIICLSINYLWLKDFDRFDDSWFFRFRSRMDKATTNLVDSLPGGWLLGVLAIYLAPLLVLAVLLFLGEGLLFGLLTMLIHILVLLIAFDRTQPGKLASNFIEKWKAGDIEACLLYLQQELPAARVPGGADSADSAEIVDKEAVGKYFSKQLIYRCFEKMFVMFFWYMLAGPIGILVCYVSYQLRDSHKVEQLEAQVKLVAMMIEVLEWVPIRLLALAFCLAGNFVKCFERVKRSFWSFSGEQDNADLLYSYATCALSGMASPTPLETQGDEGENQEQSSAEVAEIEAMLGLLERSQAIWLSVLALITIFGLRLW